MKFRKRLETLKNHIFRLKNVTFERFYPLSTFYLLSLHNPNYQVV